MQNKLVLHVIDKGEMMQVTGTSIQLGDFYADNTVYVFSDFNDDRELFEWVRARLKSSTVQYKKLDRNVQLIKEDFVVSKNDALTQKKERALTKGMNYMSSRVQLGVVFDFFNFIMANNKLLDGGYVITNENRTDKYLEIVDEGDPDLIDALEMFLTTRDRLLENGGIYTIWNKYGLEIERAVMEAEVDELYKEFVNTFE
jgi:hypothetical protein